MGNRGFKHGKAAKGALKILLWRFVFRKPFLMERK